MDIDGILTIIELILFVAGILSLLLIPVLVIAGIFLYRKNKKWLCAIPAILILFLAFSFYYSLPMYFIFRYSVEKECLAKFVKAIAITQRYSANVDSMVEFYYDFNLENGGIVSREEQKETLDKIIYYDSNACFGYDKYVEVFACQRLTNIYAMLARYDEAIYTYESSKQRLLNLDRDNYKPSYNLIELYILNKDYDGALNALNIYDFDDDIKTVYKAETYRRMGKPQEALKILNNYIASKPKNYYFRAIAFRALAHMDLGQIKQAKQDYEKAKENNRYYKRFKTFEEFIEEAKIEHSYDEMRKRKGIVLEN